MIEAHALTKAIKGRPILQGVSLTAPAGAITGFLGPNGAGKTTTLRALCGLIEPDTGTVRVDGLAVRDNPEEARARLGVLPDAKGLYRRLTARENLAYFGRLCGMKASDVTARITYLAEALGLGAFLDRRTEGFSQGERVRTALARAVIHDPPTFLLDEPTNGLDVGAQRALRAFLRAERAAGKAILLSTHALGDAQSLCDRLSVIARGRTVAEGTPEELMTHTGKSTLEEAFVALVGTEEGWVA